jgi:hypothetical protein
MVAIEAPLMPWMNGRAASGIGRLLLAWARGRHPRPVESGSAGRVDHAWGCVGRVSRGLGTPGGWSVGLPGGARDWEGKQGERGKRSGVGLQERDEGETENRGLAAAGNRHRSGGGWEQPGARALGLVDGSLVGRLGLGSFVFLF